jgi:hypothetical protein
MFTTTYTHFGGMRERDENRRDGFHFDLERVQLLAFIAYIFV